MKKAPIPPVPPRIPEEDLTPPMLVNEISRLFRHTVRQSDGDADLSQESTRHLLWALFHEDGVNQLRLTEMTHLKAPTVSVSLRKLEGAGLIRRVADENDLRAVRVFLTEQGRKRKEEIVGRLKATDKRLMRGFSEEERTVLKSYLLRMRNNILPEKEPDHTDDSKAPDGNI